MKKKANKHLGMDQDELALSFGVRPDYKEKGRKPKKKAKPKIKDENLGLTDEEIKYWNNKFNKPMND
jgi:hypothetical protein